MSHCQAWKYVASPRKWGSRVILTVSLADLFQPSWTEPLDWQGHHNVDLQHLKRLSLTLSRTITGPHVQLPSTKMLLHVSNTNKPSLERWQTSRTERRYSSNSVFSGTQHAADWCWGWPYGKKRVVTVQEKNVEFLTLRSFGTAAAVVIVPTDNLTVRIVCFVFSYTDDWNEFEFIHLESFCAVTIV